MIPEASIEALKEQLAAAQRTTFPLSCWLGHLNSTTLLTPSFPGFRGEGPAHPAASGGAERPKDQLPGAQVPVHPAGA